MVLIVQRFHNRERVHIPVEPGENYPSDVPLSVDNSLGCFKGQGPTVFHYVVVSSKVEPCELRMSGLSKYTWSIVDR